MSEPREPWMYVNYNFSLDGWFDHNGDFMSNFEKTLAKLKPVEKGQDE